MANKTLKPGIRKTVQYIAALGLLLITVLFLMSSVREVLSNMKLNRELKQVKAQYQTLVEEQERLTLEKKQLQDDNYVQNYARGTNLLSKQEETVFILPKREE